MKYLPAFVLATERLILREVDLEDAEIILKILNEPSFIRNVRDAGIRTRGDAEKYIREKLHASYQENGFGLYLVELKATGELMGLSGLVKQAGLDDVDIGFTFLPEFWAKGYAWESADGVVKYARNSLRLERLVGITSPENTPSIRVLEKIANSVRVSSRIIRSKMRERIRYLGISGLGERIGNGRAFKYNPVT